MSLSDGVITGLRFLANDIDAGLRQAPSVEVMAELCPSREENLTPPRQIFDLDLMSEAAQTRFQEARFQVPSLSLYRGKNIGIVGGFAIIVDDLAFNASFKAAGDRITPPRIPNSPLNRDPKTGTYGQRFSKNNIQTISEPVFFLGSSSDHMHHHWLFDTCPKFWVWDTFLKQGVKLAVPSTLKGYQRAAYHAMGVSDDQMITFDTKGLTIFEELIFCPRFSDANYMVKPAFLHLRERMFDAYAVKSAEKRGKLKLFLNRQDVPDDARVLMNEREIEARLLKKRFKSLSGGDLSFGDQVRYFAQLKQAVIVHGSGGANALFSNLNAHTIHLHPDSVSNFRSHGRMNGLLGQRYDYVFGPSLFRPQRLHNNPWFVDPSSVMAALK